MSKEPCNALFRPEQVAKVTSTLKNGSKSTSVTPTLLQVWTSLMKQINMITDKTGQIVWDLQDEHAIHKNAPALTRLGSQGLGDCMSAIAWSMWQISAACSKILRCTLTSVRRSEIKASDASQLDISHETTALCLWNFHHTLLKVTLLKYFWEVPGKDVIIEAAPKCKSDWQKFKLL